MNAEFLVYTVAEASEVSGIAEATLYYHARVGNLPTQKFGDQYLVMPYDLEEFTAKFKNGRHPRTVRKQSGSI